jgi:hypothetical protein
MKKSQRKVRPAYQMVVHRKAGLRSVGSGLSLNLRYLVAVQLQLLSEAQSPLQYRSVSLGSSPISKHLYSRLLGSHCKLEYNLLVVSRDLMLKGSHSPIMMHIKHICSSFNHNINNSLYLHSEVIR